MASASRGLVWRMRRGVAVHMHIDVLADRQLDPCAYVKLLFFAHHIAWDGVTPGNLGAEICMQVMLNPCQESALCMIHDMLQGL